MSEVGGPKERRRDEGRGFTHFGFELFWVKREDVHGHETRKFETFSKAASLVRGSGTPFIFLHSATRLFTHLGFEPFWVNPDSLTETKELRGGSRGIGDRKPDVRGLISDVGSPRL